LRRDEVDCRCAANHTNTGFEHEVGRYVQHVWLTVSLIEPNVASRTANSEPVRLQPWDGAILWILGESPPRACARRKQAGGGSPYRITTVQAVTDAQDEKCCASNGRRSLDRFHSCR
jgi:hypothetical protein